LLGQKPPPSIIGSNGPLSDLTPAVQSERWERVFMLRVFGRLPDTGVSERKEAGVRKASEEETAGRVVAGGDVGLWGFGVGV
jgi:hypothetical protein